MMNETQIKTAARNIARKATKLRKAGRHAEADAMVKQAAANVDAMRAAGKVVAIYLDGFVWGPRASQLWPRGGRR